MEQYGEIFCWEILSWRRHPAQTVIMHIVSAAGHFQCDRGFRAFKYSKEAADRLHAVSHVGNVLSSDLFYTETPEWKRWAELGVLGIEMESYALYCEAARGWGESTGNIYRIGFDRKRRITQCGRTTEWIQTDDGDCIGDSGMSVNLRY